MIVPLIIRVAGAGVVAALLVAGAGWAVERSRLRTYIQERLENSTTSPASGPVVLLLDGLDEAPSDRRPRLRRLLRDLADIDGLRLVITSRAVGYEPLFLRDSIEVELQPFGDVEAAGFIDAWFRGHPDSGRAAALHTALSQAESAVRELARTPLLLAFLCVLSEQGDRIVLQFNFAYNMPK